MAGVVKIEIVESESTLKTLLNQQISSLKKEQLQALYWLKSQKVKTVEHIASLLGRHRVTVQRWLREYRQRGLSGLLQEKKSSGRPRVIPEEAVERLKLELSVPQGFSSYGEVHTWLRAECGIEAAYRTVHQLVRYQLQAKLKVPRPTSIKQSETAIEEFKKNCHNN